MIVAVNVDSRYAYWDSVTQAFAGHPQVVAAANRAANLGLPVPIYGLEFAVADRATPVGALAALSAFRPGRTLLVSEPNDELDEVLDRCFGVPCATDEGEDEGLA